MGASSWVTSTMIACKCCREAPLQLARKRAFRVLGAAGRQQMGHDDDARHGRRSVSCLSLRIMAAVGRQATSQRHQHDDQNRSMSRTRTRRSKLALLAEAAPPPPSRGALAIKHHDHPPSHSRTASLLLLPHPITRVLDLLPLGAIRLLLQPLPLHRNLLAQLVQHVTRAREGLQRCGVGGRRGGGRRQQRPPQPQRLSAENDTDILPRI